MKWELGLVLVGVVPWIFGCSSDSGGVIVAPPATGGRTDIGGSTGLGGTDNSGAGGVMEICGFREKYCSYLKPPCVTVDDPSVGCGAAECYPCGTVPNSVATCRGDGACSFACSRGWLDCDADPANGCETAEDQNNCGGCGLACALTHAYAGCTASQCTITSCFPGYVDVDLTASDGCETSASNMCSSVSTSLIGVACDDSIALGHANVFGCATEGKCLVCDGNSQTGQFFRHEWQEAGAQWCWTTSGGPCVEPFPLTRGSECTTVGAGCDYWGDGLLKAHLSCQAIPGKTEWLE